MPSSAPESAPTPNQWLTYQILPPSSQQQVVGQQNLSKLWQPTTTHPSSIQITTTTSNPTVHTVSALGKQPTAAVVTSSSSNAHPMAYKANNIRIISTSPNIYNINKSVPQALQKQQQQHSVYHAPVQSYYLPNAGNPSQLNRLVAKQQQQSTQSVSMPPVPPLAPVSNSTSVVPSTVVLDRINICINNHYAESTPSQILGQQQQPSPIIPAIQHKIQPLPIIDSNFSSVSSSSYEDGGGEGGGPTIEECVSTASTVSSTVIVIDEPDSTTTTPQTPPTTPEAIGSPLTSNTSISDLSIASSPSPPPASCSSVGMKPSFKSNEASCLPLTPPSPPPAPAEQLPSAPRANYSLQEDVFIKCQDGRFYLGTIIEQIEEQFLIRFDDQSEQWCGPEKMRKLGGDSCNTSSANLGVDATNSTGPSPSATSSSITKCSSMCVACKRSDLQDIVEICERCGRGYHRGCTTEIVAGSGIWFCKRCAKPMQMHQPLKEQLIGKPEGICRQLPYYADKLSWDEKHRVNEEQIYCYCGKPGKFDQNMLQCCKCRNWFHTQCMQNFKSKLLRGDIFFVFCCTVCNKGGEFVRRLQIDWVDVLHIALYNLRKHQHQKYHHLLKDIWPFVLEQRQNLPICKEWRLLPETTLMERIKQTLRDYSERFICGREVKRDPAFYALRHSGPPLTPKVFLQENEVPTDELLVNKYNLLLLPDEKKENAQPKNVDVYEFHTDDDEETKIDVSTSEEDEIPIKHIIDKAKKQSEQMELKSAAPQPPPADDNANDATTVPAVTTPAMPITATQLQMVEWANSSRKRKAFRLSKRYDTTNSNRNHCDLSSDENSSSSRGTSSLDIIIPPPVNFLGRNNPFLMATPKKAQPTKLGSGNLALGVTSIINSLFKLKNGGGAGGCLARDQPRMVRTIKRKLSAKDITIGPNQEVRRRRTRRPITDMEVINTTTINPIPSHYFPIYAKDLHPPPPPPPPLPPPPGKLLAPSHGRLLRQRPQKSGRRALHQTPSTATSISSSSSSSSASSNGASMLDVKQSVNKYFGGAINRIDAGESFGIRAKRRLGNGQVQYLVEWTNGNR
ncbi:uncharacterized protein Dwil_GK25582 [Drosophila willistoni]|uniref:PHD-type domain-containing protein n=2 Tax=Drosophila willistoni TaxID=7260 RepID=B4NE62_DROWI|nr:uncharacterized protein Dwil_GK25582 [Drosophila willistoni]